MEPAITVAVIAAAASVIGWIVNYVFSSRSERRRAHVSARLAHREDQLKSLYGPLAFLIYEGRRTWGDLLAKLGRVHIFTVDDLSASELKLWLFWVDHDFMPRNNSIELLLASNTHLIEGDALPSSYIEFLDHHNSWQIEHTRWKEEGVEYAWHSKTDWPNAFEDEVIATFQHLMKEHKELIGMVGGRDSHRSP